KPLPREITDYNAKNDLKLGTYASAEAQVAALADDIAYNNHDIDDGLRAELFTIEDLFDLPGVGEIFKKAVSNYPNIGKSRQRHEAVRDLIGAMVTDCLTETQQRLKEAAPSNVDDIRSLGRPVVSFSEDMHEIDRSLKDFLFSNMYRHDRVNEMTNKARGVVSDLFTLLLAEPAKLPAEWQQNIDGQNDQQTAQVVADYIAGMTDRFAYDEQDKLVNK
ncbi:MAG: deoxyguanosinetriphosphate triphosphohydrolase, partial [Rhodospirillaceae bacterium]|nr:deoxyguanosinetriphosphate triphosphohydrolase [Rhodospirillaceae bacterium]